MKQIRDRNSRRPGRPAVPLGSQDPVIHQAFNLPGPSIGEGRNYGAAATHAPN